MDYLFKGDRSMKELMQVFYRLLGNKRYLSDLERILEKLDLDINERETLILLAQDLGHIQTDLNKKRYF